MKKVILAILVLPMLAQANPFAKPINKPEAAPVATESEAPPVAQAPKQVGAGEVTKPAVKPEPVQEVRKPDISDIITDYRPDPKPVKLPETDVDKVMADLKRMEAEAQAHLERTKREGLKAWSN